MLDGSQQRLEGESPARLPAPQDSQPDFLGQNYSKFSSQPSKTPRATPNTPYSTSNSAYEEAHNA